MMATADIQALRARVHPKTLEDWALSRIAKLERQLQRDLDLFRRLHKRTADTNDRTDIYQRLCAVEMELE